MRTLFIGDDLFNLLPEEEKKNFELFKTYTPEVGKEKFIREIMKIIK